MKKHIKSSQTVTVKYLMQLFIIIALTCLITSCYKSESDSDFGGTGIGGSLNKFTIIDSFLYVINGQYVECFVLSDPEIIFNSRTKIDADIETIFPFDSLILIGGQAGMYICSRSKQGKLSVISGYEHVQSCDPVVTDGKYAYVTLSGGCSIEANQLDILDVTDPFKPVMIRSYAMTHPRGLGIDGNYLFICDDYDGLRIYDCSDPAHLEQLYLFDHIKPVDVIPFNGLLFVMTGTGIHQFTYAQPDTIYEISALEYP